MMVVVHLPPAGTIRNPLQHIPKSSFITPGLIRLNAPIFLGLGPSVVAPMNGRQRGYTNLRQIAPRPKESSSRLKSRDRRKESHILFCTFLTHTCHSITVLKRLFVLADVVKICRSLNEQYANSIITFGVTLYKRNLTKGLGSKVGIMHVKRFQI